MRCKRLDRVANLVLIKVCRHGSFHCLDGRVKPVVSLCIKRRDVITVAIAAFAKNLLRVDDLGHLRIQIFALG